GLVLALMTLPTLIIVTRVSLKSVPSSIREAALGIGASKHEMIFHHVLSLAMPTVMTGSIISLARALGETAPLLLIGMNAFITSPPDGVFAASTALPTQIYIWADSPERGFVSRTSAAILVLLAFLVVMNGIAIYLRQRFERRW
ncbi:MAG TPA: ABC transporter permease subunit, partial [Sinorhizobium sp.]|nr:ABC transporter permease subunit [Sinorhizobium sp.]